MADTVNNLPEPTLTPNKDFDPSRHDVRVLQLRGRPIFDWDILHRSEILKEQVGDLMDTMLTDGAIGDGWKATVTGTNVVVGAGRIKMGSSIIEIFSGTVSSDNTTIALIPSVELENICSSTGPNADRLDGTAETFKLTHNNLRGRDGTAATPPNGELNDYRNGLVDFYVQGTDADIVLVDAANGFITFNRALTLFEINQGVYISYYYGRTGTQSVPAILYSTIELIRVTEVEDPYLKDDITGISGAWRDKFKITFILDTTSGSWDKILVKEMAHTGYGTTYFVMSICTIIDGKIVSDNRPKALVKTDVAPYGDHEQLENLYKDGHPQYLTKERHEGIDHSKFMEGLSKLSGVTIFNISGYSDRTTNVDVIRPYIATVQAIDSTHVDVYFSEQMDLVTVMNPANYAILDLTTQQIAVNVYGVSMLPSGAAVRLTTGTQANKTYRMVVTGVKDNFGNLIDPDKNKKDFAGMAP